VTAGAKFALVAAGGVIAAVTGSISLAKIAGWL